MKELFLIPLLTAGLVVTEGVDRTPPQGDGSAVPTLTAIEEGPEAGAYTLVCQGRFEHHLVEAEDGLLITVELPQVRNAVPADRLPPPGPLVKEISVTDADPASTRVDFALQRPASARAIVSGRGLQLWFGGEAPPSAPAASREIPLGAEDLLEFSVFESPELNRTVRVSSRGTISLPLLGEMKVEGLTPMQLETKLSGELEKRYLQDPQVSIFVREHGSRKASVLGAVGKPGVYEMLGSRTLLEVLSQAGGLTKDAGTQLYIVRESHDTAPDRIAINVRDLMSNSDPGLNVAIQPGDIITVPIDEMIYVYVDGAVRSPGRIEQPASRPITLLQAIAKAGGTTERANLKKVQILRKGSAGSQPPVPINLKQIRQGKVPDPLLHDGDIVVIPETFF